jgi:hypothetical protein
VVIAGTYTFMDVIHALKRTEYIPYDANRIVVHAINPFKTTYSIEFSDDIMRRSLTEQALLPANAGFSRLFCFTICLKFV